MTESLCISFTNSIINNYKTRSPAKSLLISVEFINFFDEKVGDFNLNSKLIAYFVF